MYIVTCISWYFPVAFHWIPKSLMFGLKVVDDHQDILQFNPPPPKKKRRALIHNNKNKNNIQKLVPDFTATAH